jgi:hypothetical protein
VGPHHADGVTWALTMYDANVRLAHVVAALAFLGFAIAPYCGGGACTTSSSTSWIQPHHRVGELELPPGGDQFPVEQPDFQPTAVRWRKVRFRIGSIAVSTTDGRRRRSRSWCGDWKRREHRAAQRGA